MKLRRINYFSKPYLLVLLFFGGSLFAACSPGPLSNTELVPSPVSILVTWERSGGIAGMCQRLSISKDRSFEAEDCNQGESLGEGQLPAEDWTHLDAWQQEYQVFEWNIELPPGSADMSNDSYRFSGSGMEIPSQAEQEEINSYLADLYTRLSETRE